MQGIQTILNIAGGKIQPFPFPESEINLYSVGMTYEAIVNLDFMYLDPMNVEDIIGIQKVPSHYRQKFNVNCGMDIYEFLERYHLLFDGISMYRFLEHVPKTKVLYFIYLLSTAVKIGGYVDIIVPDYTNLAERIIHEDVNSTNFESEDIITTFELLNEPSNPHCSVWTENRIHYFFGLEGRFQIEYIQSNYEFDGRDIYIRFIAKRIK